MFEKEIPFERNKMIDFLSHHSRYYTMHSWNGLTSYANNVKLYNLDLPDDLKDKAYDFIYAECFEYTEDVNNLIDDFRSRTGYTAGFNGRSSGYIVLYDTSGQYNENISYKSVDADADFEDWDDNELKQRVQLITEFDKLCDLIRSSLIYYLREYDVIDEEYTVVKTRAIAIPKNQEMM